MRTFHFKYLLHAYFDGLFNVSHRCVESNSRVHERFLSLRSCQWGLVKLVSLVTLLQIVWGKGHYLAHQAMQQPGAQVWWSALFRQRPAAPSLLPQEGLSNYKTEV